jgi:iron(III) transport system substrate-binding protein
MACQPQSPTSAPAATEAKPAATTPTTGAAQQQAGWEKQWNDLVAAAQQEGKVVVKGPPDPEVRTQVPRAFKERYGIEVEYIGGPTGPWSIQLQNERQAGLYSTDVVLSGGDSMYSTFYRLKILDPLLPVLIHADAADASKWPNGKLWFMDPEQQYILRLTNSLQILGHINTAQVKPEELKSWADLLRPEYKGKIAAFDPRGSGSGIGMAAYLYLTLGEEYVRKLFIDQQPTFSQDARQLADWVARGAYPIVIGGSFLSDAELRDLQKGGIPVANLPRFPEAPGGVSPSFGLLGLLNNAPHPSAAKVFVNWLASKDGMEVWSKALGEVPVRSDIDRSYWPKDQIPDPNVQYHDSFGWDFVLNQRQPLIERLRQMLR